MARQKTKPKVVGTPHAEFMAEQLKNPEFRAAYTERKLARIVATAFRDLREQAGLTQRKLADRMGISQPMIARIESGSDERTPGLDVLTRAGRAAGKSLLLKFVKSPDPKAAPLIIESEGKSQHMVSLRKMVKRNAAQQRSDSISYTDIVRQLEDVAEQLTKPGGQASRQVQQTADRVRKLAQRVKREAVHA